MISGFKQSANTYLTSGDISKKCQGFIFSLQLSKYILKQLFKKIKLIGDGFNLAFWLSTPSVQLYANMSCSNVIGPKTDPALLLSDTEN